MQINRCKVFNFYKIRYDTVNIDKYLQLLYDNLYI
jgi:hypothetical protein